METIITKRAAELMTEYKKYEVDMRRCRVDVGDLVTPETIVGWHHETGRPLKADLHGQIATLYFNPMHDSLMIMAISRNN